ncbi:PilZ domain-containing protein [Fervidobacterium islandicum]|uniref:PilZ domain-containing protein n=1 Tax=Fervidobacterium islandicum TaxID=2423 RepID=A0AAI8CIB3_FERIS|nr:PilZ domain-containing protein [Fervidobacterium islandicum]AMW32046.1 PilZ domain-containing protein [Fervidobacterium islandicum]
MTLEEYVNANLSGAVLRGFSKDGELLVRLRELHGRNLKISFLSFASVPEILRVDIPIEGFVLSVIGKLTAHQEGIYEYTALDKAGILQRRAKPRYAAFEPCSIYGFHSIIIDVSENGCQVISEFKPRVKESVEMRLRNNTEEIIDGTVMWSVEEEECYRYGVYIPNPSSSWMKLVEKYKNDAVNL